MATIWRYVIQYNHGAAPNYDPPCPTLAICKPAIRRGAAVGDLVMAFSGGNLIREGSHSNPHSIVWAGLVSKKMDFTQYWNSPNFNNKKQKKNSYPDNIYAPDDFGNLNQVKNNSHGHENIKNDLSGKYVLIFEDNFWDFSGMDILLPEEFRSLEIPLNARVGHRRSEIDSGKIETLIKYFSENEIIDQNKKFRSRKENCRVQIKKEVNIKCTTLPKKSLC